MLPEGWQSLFLGDVFNFKNGLNGEKSLYGAGAKFVNVMDVFRGPRLRHREIVGEMAVSPRQLTEFAVKLGDVLFNRTSETDDEIALSTVYLDTAPAVFGGFVIRARPSGKALDQDFCVYGFQADSIRREMIRRGQGAIRSNIGQADLATVPILLPPLPEQRKIAEILSTWDAAISAQERLIANAKRQKKALMQTLLPTGAQPPKKRLPGFSGAWREHELGEIATFKGGCGFKESYQGKTSGEWPFIKVSDMNLPGNEQEIFHSQNWVDRPDAKAMRANPMPPRAIVFAKVGAALMLNRRRRLTRPTIIDNNMMAAIPDEKSITSDFLFLHMKTVDLGKFAQASAVPSVNQQHLAELPIILPPLAEQRKIAEILSTWDAEIFAQERLIANACAQKKALMQQLLTGKRRVKLEEAAR